MDASKKPTLLFLRFARRNLPAFIQLHLRQQLLCLEHSFRVIVIDESCDYRQLCDEHQPDISLFESGVYVGQRTVANVSANPHIPKLGLCHCDAYCDSRKVFAADIHEWGIDTYFTISVSMPSYTPSLADSMFVWPNFIDPTICYDYKLPKLIPILFTGSQATHYPGEIVSIGSFRSIIPLYSVLILVGLSTARHL